MASRVDDEPQLQYPPPLEAARGSEIHVNGHSLVDMETPVLIVGGGPVGMLQALLLARVHGQACTLIERETTTTTFPKMEYTNGRSMEIYRKMGLSEEFRALGTAEVPEHVDNNEIIVSSLRQGGKLIHIWERDGAKQQKEKSRGFNNGSQYLEPHLRCHQIIVERWLKEKVEGEKLIKSHWGMAFVGLEERETHVISELKTRDGAVIRVKSQYVIGADGGGSWVRKSAGLESKRNYLDMTVAFVHFRSSKLRSEMPFPRFWHANVVGGGILVSQNEDDLWTCHFIVPPGIDPADLSAEEILAYTIGGCQGPKPIPYDEIYCRGVWKTDVAIANKFISEQGRVFLAGDAAHQLSPVGGHGLNSGLGDAFDLAWKLTATIKGWGRERLLPSYNEERRQIAFENLGHVQDGLAAIGEPIFGAIQKFSPEVVNGDNIESENVRTEISQACEKAHWLHDQNGNILGMSYNRSPVIAEEDETNERPRGTDNIYVPTTFPGSRAPHVWMEDGSSTLDSLSASAFSLVDFSHGTLSAPFVHAAQNMGIPLQVLTWRKDDNEVGKIYERDLILIRPDMYVAWRCSEDIVAPVSEKKAVSVLQSVSGG